MKSNAHRLAALGLLSVASLLASGCKQTVMDVNGRDAVITPEVAVIRAQGNTSYVKRINGRDVKEQMNRKFVVAPGETTVHIGYRSNNSGGGGGITISGGPGDHDITFNARAGHEYEMGYQTMWIGRKPYLHDVTAKKDLVEYKIDGEWAYPGEKDAPAPAAKK